jgi:hypothetical protein
LSVDGGASTITDCTFEVNSAGTGGGAYVFPDAIVDFVSSDFGQIFAANAPDDIGTDASSYANLGPDVTLSCSASTCQ